MRSGTSFQNGEADHAIADMPVIGLIEALCDSFHAEHGFVEARHSLLILGIQSEMSNFSRHNFSLLSERPVIGTRHNKPSQSRQRLESNANMNQQSQFGFSPRVNVFFPVPVTLTAGLADYSRRIV